MVRRSMAARLKPDVRRKIDKMLADGQSLIDIARAVGVHRQTVGRYVAGSNTAASDAGDVAGSDADDGGAVTFSTDETAWLRIILGQLRSLTCGGCGAAVVYLATAAAVRCDACQCLRTLATATRSPPQ